MAVVSFYTLALFLVLFGVLNLFFDLKTSHRLGVFLLLTGYASVFSLAGNYQQVFFASIVSFIVVILAYSWNKYIFARLNLKRTVSKDKIFINDKLYYEVEIENKKLLPVPRISLKDNVTNGIEFINEKFHTNVPGIKANIFTDGFSFKWYEKVRKRYEIIPRQRGYYKFGEGNLFYYGVFGLFKNSISSDDYTELVVYPRILPAKNIDIELRQLFGSQQSDGWIHRDPLNKVGVRPYRTTDSIKEINWKASARHKELESDIYNPSFDPEVHIFLSNLTTKDWWEGIIRNKLELAIIYAASLVNYGINNDYQVGLYSDGLIKNSSKYISISPGKNQSHKDKLLTTLAMIETANQVQFSKILSREKKNIRKGSTVVIICSYISAETEKMISLYKKYYNLHLIKIGGSKEYSQWPGINTYYVDQEKKWNEISQMSFNEDEGTVDQSE